MHDNERFALSTERAGPRASTTPTLDQVGIDLTAQARQGKLAPVSGRDKDLERVIQVLARSPLPRTGIRKNNIALIIDLISEPERGRRKLAIVEGLAKHMIAHHAPAVASRSEAPESSWLVYCLEKLQDKRLVTLDIGLLVIGTPSQREVEERVKQILEEIRSSQECILVIDELHTLVGAGATVGRVDVAPLLVPALARGEIQCIGATTLEEYRTDIEQDPVLQRHFQEVIVHEMVAPGETVLNQRGDSDPPVTDEA